MKLYVHCPQWFIRPRNTDWRYVRYTLPRMSEYGASFSFILSTSVATVWRTNARYLETALRRRMFRPRTYALGTAIDQDEFKRSGCGALYCHDDFPLRAEGIPVVWQNSLLDREMLEAAGVDANRYSQLIEEKREGFKAASLVLVSTEAERSRLSRMFPDCEARFAAVPFFLPGCEIIQTDALEQKIMRDEILRCVFVGHEAKRKGLDRVYRAISGLRPSVRARVHLTVVSAEADGRVDPPPFANLRIHKALPRSRVLSLMRSSDVLLMPSLFESYGLVFVEAMSQGTIPVVPDWEVQREIVDYGRAGIVTSGDPSELSALIERLCEDKRWRSDLAQNASARFAARYTPERVVHAFEEALNRTFVHGVNGDIPGFNLPGMSSEP